jgi:ribosome-associated protein
VDKVKLILKVLEEKGAENIKVIDLRNTGNVGDYAVVADASNPRLLKALSEYVEEALAQAGDAIHHIEGKANSDWILLDVYDVIVHLFIAQARQFYRLDELYIDRWMQVE